MEKKKQPLKKPQVPKVFKDQLKAIKKKIN